MFVFPDSKVGGRDAAARFYRRRLGHDHRGTADSATTQVHEVPIVCEAILAGVLTHWRHGNAIAENNIANS
jgi:hypothetical protein